MIALALLVLSLQIDGRDAAAFARRAAEFDRREAQLKSATGPARSAAALEWLRALRNVLQAIPIERVAGAHEQWLKEHGELIIYSEPAGEWLIGSDVLAKVYEEHAKSAAADEIAWLAATNGLSGECEGYVPCYSATLNMLYGEYLRRHPQGTHRLEAFDLINESLAIVVDDLLKRPDRADFLSVPRDCPDLVATAVPLRAAVAGANGAKATLALIDRLIASCPKP